MVAYARLLYVSMFAAVCFTATANSAGASTNDTTTLMAYGYDYDHEENMTSYEYGSGESSGSNTDDEDDYYIEYTTDEYDPNYDQDKQNRDIEKRVGRGKWFTCDSGRVKITKDKVCDGFRDCYDCSDEWNCTSTSRNFFYCFGKDHGKFSIPYFFSQVNPMCIPRHKFCDGERDCLNGADEVQSGVGFKCAVKDQFRTCLLPEDMVCDDYADCEDRSDLCAESANLTSPTRFVASAAAGESAKHLFRCLNNNATVFMHQVCDGVIDCPDMSDECLCRHPASPAINSACASVCWNRIWSGGAGERPASCGSCDIGETLSPLPIGQNASQGRVGTRNATCTKPSEICTSEAKDHAEICQHRPKSPDRFVKCLIVDGSFRTINARMCDGRPECFFGEDECVPACDGTRNQFCQLLVPEFGYRCSNKTTGSLGELLTIQPCDGEPQCYNATDEMFCPNRYPCLVEDGEGSAVASTHTHTFDILEMCDGHDDCRNGADEHPTLCQAKRDEPCDVTGDEPCDEERDCPILADLRNSADGALQWQLDVKREATNNLVLQYGVLVLASCGVVGNLYGLLVALINSVYLLKRERYRLATFLRESVMFTSIATAKLAVSSCFAYTLLRVQNQSMLGCAEKLTWRASSSCQVIGTVTLIAFAVPWLVLTCYASVISCRREVSNEVTAKPVSARKPYSKLFACLLALLIWILLWAPIAFIVVALTSRGDSRAWVKMDALSDDLFGNIIDQQRGRTFSERVATMGGGVEPVALSRFSWSQFADVISKWAPSLGFRLVGVFGYYSLSEFCLPMFLSRPVLVYNSVFSMFSFSFTLAICALGLYITARVIHAWKNSKRKAKDDKQGAVSLSSLTLFWAIESLTWGPILGMYFVKLAWTEYIDNLVFQAAAVGLLAANCGVASVFVHARKCRVHFRLCSGEEVESAHPLADNITTPKLTVDCDVSETTSLKKVDEH